MRTHQCILNKYPVSYVEVKLGYLVVKVKVI